MKNLTKETQNFLNLLTQMKQDQIKLAEEALNKIRTDKNYRNEFKNKYADKIKEYNNIPRLISDIASVEIRKQYAR